MNSRQTILDASKVIAPTQTEVQTFHLTRAQYDRLEQQFLPRVQPDPTTAAIQLGQQMVLAAVRKGFTA